MNKISSPHKIDCSGLSIFIGIKHNLLLKLNLKSVKKVLKGVLNVSDNDLIFLLLNLKIFLLKIEIEAIVLTKMFLYIKKVKCMEGY